MSRYVHEFTLATPTGGTGPCRYCDKAPTIAIGNICAVRQRRHDTFVAAALTGNIVLVGAGVLAAVTQGRDNPPTLKALLDTLIPDAIECADRVMAELSK